MIINKCYSKVVLAYFSGTGSSEEVCNCFENKFVEYGLEVAKINISEKYSIETLDADLIVIISPVYAFRIASITEKWVSRLPNGKDIKVAIISVSGGGEVSPNTACREKCKKILRKKYYHVIYEKMIVMPSNFFVQAQKEINYALLDILPYKINNIIKDILEGKGNLSNPKMLDRFFSAIGRMEHLGAIFWGASILASSECNSCYLCINKCPQKNITMVAGKPKFSYKCIFCLKCIYNCPKKALYPRIMKSVVLKNGYNIKEFSRKNRDIYKYSVNRNKLWAGVIEYLSDD